MFDDIVKQVIRDIADECFLPPRFVYGRRAGDKAPFRRRLRPRFRPYEYLLFNTLRRLGFSLRVWSPGA